MSESKNKNWLGELVMTLENFRAEQTAGRNEVVFNELFGSKHIDAPHKHDFFVLILFDSATGVHQIDTADYPIENRQLHVLFPNQLHRWDMALGTTAYQLMVERRFFEKFAPFFRFSFTNYQNHPVIPLTDKSFSALLYEFIAIRDELKNEDYLVQIVNARASVIAALISKEAERNFRQFDIYQANPKLAQFNYLIDKHYREHKSVKFYADRLNISNNYLNVLCKKNINVSATTLIYRRIIIEAKRYLSLDLSIKEIAFKLGYADHAYFSNFFKKQTGMSPSEFRM